jgi:hypothetical protein
MTGLSKVLEGTLRNRSYTSFRVITSLRSLLLENDDIFKIWPWNNFNKISVSLKLYPTFLLIIQNSPFKLSLMLFKLLMLRL